MAEDTPSSPRAPAGPSDAVKLAVYCPQRPVQNGSGTADLAGLDSKTEKIEVPASSTVRDVKAKLEQDFPGGPLADAQTLLWHGRRLSDDEVLQQVVQGTQQVSPSTNHLQWLAELSSHAMHDSLKWAMCCILSARQTCGKRRQLRVQHHYPRHPRKARLL